MTTTTTLRRAAATVMVAGALGGCAQLGGLENVLGTVLGGGQQQGQLVAEIQGVDTRQQAIHVRTQDGRTGAVRYDRNTQVIYRQQQYPVTALERGDVATLEVQPVRNDELYVSRVLVQQSAQERSGQAPVGGDVQQLSGRVGQVNPQGGLFELQTGGGTVTVSLAANAPSHVVNRFRNLRQGEAVSIQGRWVAASMMELHAFL
jgi:hypothetical protein